VEDIAGTSRTISPQDFTPTINPRADRITQTRGALDVHRSMVIAHSDFSLDIVFH